MLKLCIFLVLILSIPSSQGVQVCLQILKVKLSELEFLLCPNRPVSIWEQLGCLENIVLRREKGTDPYPRKLAVCISDHFTNIVGFVVAAGCNLF